VNYPQPKDLGDEPLGPSDRERAGYGRDGAGLQATARDRGLRRATALVKSGCFERHFAVRTKQENKSDLLVLTWRPPG
jgi:hypothetical protein